MKPETVSKIAEFLSSLSDSHSEDARRLAGLSLQDGECDWDLLIQAQELAGRQANWVIVLAIADYMRAFCMKSARAYSVIFDALYHLGRSEEAEDTLREALPLFPKSHAITVKWARLATIQQDYQVAAQRWLAVLQDHPTIEECYKTGAFCLQQLGDAAGAAALLRDGMNILPQAIDVWLQYVATAITAGDVAEAKARWLRRQSEFSEDSDTSLLGAQIAFACNDFAEANALLEQSVRTTGGSETEEQNSLRQKLNVQEVKEIMMQFESLGGRMEGCEFGLVQRAYGAEPLGLLRWSDMAPDALIDALENKFEGVGELECTILSSPHVDGADWTTQNSRYGMNTHTFQYDQPSEETRNRLFRAICRRLRYLKEKLLTDLSTGEKVFVYKVTYDVLSDAQLHRLHQAIQKFGRSTLLYVRQPDDGHPAGTVEWHLPGLMIGYIQRFSYGFGHGAPLIGRATEHWEIIIRRAHELWGNRSGGHIGDRGGPKLAPLAQPAT